MPTRPDRRATFARIVLLSAAALSAGCSWFRHDDATTAIEPQPAADAYRSPLKADPGRTGDYRRAGLLNNRRPTTLAATRPTTVVAVAPSVPSPLLAASRPAAALPEYLVLGSVVANVNGSPIYANELLQNTAPALRARARDLDQARFRALAQDELKRERDHLIGDELEYAAAQRNTTSEEQRQAQQITFMRREQLISQAGGSLEAARAQAREQGTDFDTMLAKEERVALVGIYYRKRIIPRVTLTVDEMRRYYEQHRNDQFTTPSTATMRVVKVPLDDASGDEALARQRADDARRRIAGGEDFDAISKDFNKAGPLADRKGLVGPISKGAYAVAALDDAVWQTPPGEATPVVREGNAFYVARVVDRHDGGTKPFDDPEVQRQIQAAIRESKMLEITRKRRDELSRDAVIQADEAMLGPAVDMAMQLYPTWHAGGR